MGADPQASVKATMVSEIGLGLKVSASTAMLHLSVVERDVASARIGVGGGANATVADIKMADDIESWMQFFCAGNGSSRRKERDHTGAGLLQYGTVEIILYKPHKDPKPTPRGWSA